MCVGLTGLVRGLAIVLLVAATCAAPARAETRRLTLDDVLSLEGYGSAAFSPGGRWLVYEQVRPYDQNTDYSFRTYAFEKSGHQLFAYDLEAGGAPRLLSGLDSAAHSYQVGFAPAGERLAVMQYSFGRLTLGAYDLARDTYTAFAATPAFSRDGAHNPVWINREELVYAALPEGEQPALTSVRTATAQLLQESWQAAWTGAGVTAREVRTGRAGAAGAAKPGSLIRAHAATGAAREIGAGLYADLRVAPGGARLAGLAVSSAAPLAAGDLAEGDRQIYRLSVFDLEADRETRLAPGLTFSPYSLVWAPDGRRLAAFGWPDGGDPRQGRFHVIDTVSGHVTVLPHHGLDLVSEAERGWHQRPERAVFLGGGLAVFARAIPDGEDPAPRFTYSDVRPEGQGPAHWYLIAADAAPVNLTRGLSGVSHRPVQAAGDTLTLQAAEGLFRISAHGNRTPLDPRGLADLRQVMPGHFATRADVIRPDFAPEAVLQAIRAGAPVGILSDAGSAAPAPLRTFALAGARSEILAGSVAAGALLYRTEDGPVSELRLIRPDVSPGDTVLSRINPHLSGVTLGDWQTVRYEVPGPEGARPREHEACVLLPPGFDPAAPPPLIVDLYPDAPARCRPQTSHMAYPDPQSPYLWAAQGFAYVRLPMPRALIWEQDAPLAGMPALAEAGAEAIVRAGYAEAGALALHGFSQGGVSALYVAAHSDRFAAVIAKNSWADFVSHYFGTVGINSLSHDRFGAFRRYDTVAGSEFGIGKTPFEAPEVYYRNSPVFLAPQIEMPVMLIHSDLDSFALSQFDEMFGALERAGKIARYVRYLGEGHAPSSPANIRDMWARQIGFLSDAGVCPQGPERPDACRARQLRSQESTP